MIVSDEAVATLADAAIRFRALGSTFVSSGVAISDDEGSSDEEAALVVPLKATAAAPASRLASSLSNPARIQKFKDSDDGQDDDDDEEDEATGQDNFFLADSDEDNEASTVPSTLPQASKRSYDDANSEQGVDRGGRGGRGGFGGGRGLGAPRTFNRNFGAASKFLRHDNADKANDGTER